MAKTLFARAFAAVLFTTTSGIALAQDASPIEDVANTDGEIIVTAQRREQSLLDVPVAVTAIGGDNLAKRGISNSSQLGEAVPNLQINSPYGRTQPNFSLRGIGVANEYNSNQASPVGVYLDDVYLAPRTSHGMGLFDLDRVEVLRGPQGTLFGRNTTGGAINFITRKPDLQGTEGYAELGYGNFDTFTAQGAVEATLSPDAVGLRLAVNYAKGDGQIRNVFAGGRDPNSTDTLQGRVSLRIKPSDALDVVLRAYGGRDRGTQAGVHGLLPFRTGLDFFETNENRVGDNRTDAWGFSGNIALSLSDRLTVTSITSYDGGKQDLQQAADGSPLDILDITWQSQYRQFSQELRGNFSSDGVDFVGGLFYGWDRNITDNRFNLPLPPAGGFFQHYRQVRRSYAVFGQADIDLTPNLVLTLGARYTEDKSRYDDAYAYLFVGTIGAPDLPIATTVPCAGVAGTCAYNPAARFALADKNSALTGRVALSYTTDGGTLLYASYNRGYRAGAVNGGGYTSSSGISYIKPERVNAYELGLKGRALDRALTYAISAFYYDYTNQQLQDTRAGPVSFLVNAPKSEVYGLEVESTLRATPRLRFDAALGLLRSRYKDLTLQGTDLSGNRLPFAPEVTAQFGFSWDVLDLAGGTVTFAPNVAYSSQQWFSPFNGTNATGSAQDNSELQQGANAKVNASLSWSNDKLTVRAFANNLFDRETYGYGLDLRGAGFPYNFLVPAAPRTYGVSVKVSY
ncbi:outer membrane receptor protein involved in Fe transport [Novosphingobium kunmingense]|uniref:Outer membrane receptor protein involved in Fe transport n=1 Tax=Novosphingobium kunmingense TaxID=1211806 RepID=A0A2N0H668_9SPHN|nr:TonB-dependent receptor [Novosphingobium kunmingense]PKB14402.1 outer membrane receptor protein involved in Fe transport [Novosphingobium kunmingense]